MRSNLPEIMEQLTADNKRLREALMECGRHCGGGFADTVSTDFLMLVPDEVKLALAKSRGETK